MKPHFALLLLLALPWFLGCASSTRDQLLATSESQLALRSIQTRAFDTSDVRVTVRTIISTLQDLGFVVDQANAELGSVSATKLDRYRLRMTVVTRQRGEDQLTVRANAQFQNKAVEDALPYQQFFSALEKAMFLTAQQVD